MKLRKCPKCGRYTLQEVCPECGSKTRPAHPIVSGKRAAYACDYIVQEVLKRLSHLRSGEHSE